MYQLWKGNSSQSRSLFVCIYFNFLNYTTLFFSSQIWQSISLFLGSYFYDTIPCFFFSSQICQSISLFYVRILIILFLAFFFLVQFGKPISLFLCFFFYNNIPCFFLFFFQSAGKPYKSCIYYKSKPKLWEICKKL